MMYNADWKTLASFILGTDLDRISERVILAPCWLPDSVGITAVPVTDKNCKIWYCKAMDITYIVTGVGAALCSDIVMALQYSRCRCLLFMGSAGALSDNIKIGDFAIPHTVLCGEGASRYLSLDLQTDVFGKAFPSDPDLSAKLRTAANDILFSKGFGLHDGVGISVESIFSQYQHIEAFRHLGCTLIDMETSAVFAAASRTNMKCAAVYCISDNVSTGRPLYAVSEEDTSYRKAARKTVIPALISEFAHFS